MRVINEILQWTALGVLAALVVGLYRQLAVFLGIHGADRLDRRAGPAVGARLPRDLMAVLRAAGAAGAGRLVFIAESCRGCQRLLAELRRREATEPRIVVVLSPDASDHMEAAVAGLNGVVGVRADEGGWQSARVITTPLVLDIDDRSIVREKRITHTLQGWGFAASNGGVQHGHGPVEP